MREDLKIRDNANSTAKSNFVARATQRTTSDASYLKAKGRASDSKRNGKGIKRRRAETVLGMLRRWGTEPPREFNGAQAAAEYADGTTRRDIYGDVGSGRLRPTRLADSNILIFNSVWIDLDRLLTRFYEDAGLRFRKEDYDKCKPLYETATVLGKRPTVPEIVKTLTELGVLTKETAERLLAELKN